LSVLVVVCERGIGVKILNSGGRQHCKSHADILFAGTQGLIFVIDSSDKARIDEARQELHRIINDREMKESLLLVFANKQDIPGGMHRFCTQKDKLVLTKFVAMKPQEVTDALKLSQLKDKIWFVVPSCATTGEGLLEGLVYSPMSPPTASFTS
jgi:ADP-ribosylation factor protein 6